MATYSIRDRANLFRSGQVDTTDIKDGAVTLDKVAQDVVDYVDTSVANVSVDLTGYATETYVGTAIANLVDTAPTTLDTLNELAAALGDDPNFATTVTTALGNKADTSSLATVATSGSYTDLINKPTLFSGSYTDLTDKPTIPTATSSLTNDSGFITSSSLTGLATETYVDTAVSTKQETLVSGTNIKTINGSPILGSGDIVVAAGASEIVQTSKVITEDTVIDSGHNAMSIGDVTIADGVTVTIDSSSRWVVI